MRLSIFSLYATTVCALRYIPRHLSCALGTVTDTCYQLKHDFPNITLLPEDDGYLNETKISWSTSAWQRPGCVFSPHNAQQLSKAVTQLSRSQTPFAMRGGGHMPIADAANIMPPALSHDRSYLSIGPGHRWGDVYSYLDGTGLMVVGGRLGPVGVPGLLLGGGISFYSFSHGLASAGGKIKAYECVPANGSIVTATATNTYSDLWWAFQGGGNSFAIVTRFDLQTLYDHTPLIAEASYGSGDSVQQAFLSAIVAFITDPDADPYADITPIARWGANYTQPAYYSTLFYNGSTAPASGPVAQFVNSSTTTLPADDGSSALMKLPLATYGSGAFAAFQPGGESYGLRQKFRVISAKATKETIQIIHDTYFDVLNSSGISSHVEEFFTGFAFNPVTTRKVEACKGSPYNIPMEPAFWVEQSVTWASEDDDAVIGAILEEVDAKIEEKLREINGISDFIFLNDADKGQEVFESYGAGNLRRLKGN